MLANDLESEFINWEIDLEKTVGGIGISMAKNSVGKRRKMGMGTMIFVKTARNLTRLIDAQKKRLILASFGVLGVEIGDNFLGSSENFGALKRGLLDE